MGSYYQSKAYFKGGKRRTRKTLTRKNSKKGGFYPSVMGGVVGSGKYLMPLVLQQGYKLVNNKKKSRKTLRKKNK
jgi:H+/Cl- antiporter ClcA